MTRTLPTERLAGVISEASSIVAAHNKLRLTLSQIIRDWGVMPQEAALAELREALDQAGILPTQRISDALAYLKVNRGKLDNARNAIRKQRGLEPRDADIILPEADRQSPPKFSEVFTLEDIEEKLKGLSTE
jgi:hypothetical protein